MKRKAAGMSCKEEMDDDLYDNDDDNDDIRNLAENLRVFCVSSTEYQKIKDKNECDGPPMVSDRVVYCVSPTE
jgi:hypothetical protein